MTKVSKKWLIGFIEGEGNFNVVLSKSFNGKWYPFEYYPILQFRIFLRKDDSEVLKKIKNTLGVGKIYQKNMAYYRKKGINSQDQEVFCISSLKELGQFRTFLLNSTFHSKKKEDMTNFFKILDLKKSKAHLNKEGNNQILALALNMNSKNRENFKVKPLTE